MRRRVCVLLAASVLAVTGCSSSGEAPTTVKIEPRHTEKLPGKPGPPSDEAVATALERLKAADTGRFESKLYAGGAASHLADSAGSYRLSTREATLSIEKRYPGKRRWRFDLRQRGYVAFRRYSGRAGKEQDCWAGLRGALSLPSQVQALLTAEGGHRRSTNLWAVGTVDLQDAINVLGPGWNEVTAKARSKAKLAGARLTVKFRLDHGAFAGWNTGADDILRAFRRASVPLNDLLRRELNGISVTVTLTDLGRPVTVDLPTTGLC